MTLNVKEPQNKILKTEHTIKLIINDYYINTVNTEFKNSHIKEEEKMQLVAFFAF